MTVMERWNALSERERYLVLGAAAVAVLVLLRYGSLPGEDEFESASADAPWVQVAKVENYRRVLSRTAAAEKQAKEIQDRLAAQQERLASGATATQVAAELQGTVSSMAADAGLNVLSTQILKAEESEGSRRVGVRLTLSGEIEGVSKLIAAVEGGAKDLMVTHLEINRKLGSTRRPSAASRTAEPATQPPLTVSVEVKSFMRQGS